jgi:NAD(P)-dependent dehydrogenase (short-subunit alcohol dehydrogenase family)
MDDTVRRAPPASPPVVLVTGAAQGLGLAVARRLRERGSRVHLVSRTDGERERRLRDEFGPRVHLADLTQAGATRAAVGAVLAAEGRLDAAVHAVGDLHQGTLEATGAGDLEHLFRSNLLSAWQLVEATRGALRQSRGSWLFFGLAGLGGLRARRTTAAYAALKSALVVLVRSLAQEEGPHGVRANLISPGLVPHAGAHPGTLDPTRQANIPLGRVGRPVDVAAAAEWLLGTESAYVTGQDLEVAGGWLL